MGKKLRTRELFSDTDSQMDDQKDSLPAAVAIGPSSIRKIIKSRITCKKSLTEHKVNRFRSHLSSPAFDAILQTNRFECSICLELMVNPTMLSCGHAYCFRCLESNAAYSEKCCLCRSEQKGEPHIPLKIAETIIEKFLLPYGPELLKYLCRTTDSSEWAKRRKIANFRQGLVVDFQDKCHVWRRGVIVNVLNTDLIEIKFNVKGIDFFEKVERSSRRLAPYTFFTRSRYLEDFPTTLPEYDPIQKEMSKIEYRCNWKEDSTFNFPEEESEVRQRENVDGEEHEFEEDEALRIFNFEMNEIDSILNF